MLWGRVRVISKRHAPPRKSRAPKFSHPCVRASFDSSMYSITTILEVPCCSEGKVQYRVRSCTWVIIEYVMILEDMLPLY
ncbi:hypothetical protein FKM82_023070 [Ascaphus truei]